MLKLHMCLCLLSFLCATEACHDLYYNKCTGDADCCSGFCFKGDDGGWQEGVCKPKNGETGSVTESKPTTSTPSPTNNSNCHDLYYNKCADDSECCSGFCFKGDQNEWEKGVCKTRNGEAGSAPGSKPPSSTAGCHELWYNKCTENSECCSGLCFKGDDNGWQIGVCKEKK